MGRRAHGVDPRREGLCVRYQAQAELRQHDHGREDRRHGLRRLPQALPRRAQVGPDEARPGARAGRERREEAVRPHQALRARCHVPARDPRVPTGAAARGGAQDQDERRLRPEVVHALPEASQAVRAPAAGHRVPPPCGNVEREHHALLQGAGPRRRRCAAREDLEHGRVGHIAAQYALEGLSTSHARAHESTLTRVTLPRRSSP